MPDLHYEHPRLAAIYDVGNGWSEDRDFYLSLGGEGKKRILDLGCGTGALCNAYAARGHAVTGVDPASAMLDMAKRTAHGDRISWVHSTAQAFRSDDRFDLIIMTGHAFQVLLDESDVAETFGTVRDHLADDGRFVFESRNPSVDWWKRWDGGRADHSFEGTVFHETRRMLSREGDGLRFETHYHFPEETLTSTSELRFLGAEAITAHLAAGGLVVETLLGDWQGAAFDEAASDEMIFVGRHQTV